MRKLFDNIALNQLQALCNILAESDFREVSYIRDKYLERVLWFDETLLFLQELKIVGKNSIELIPLKRFPDKSNSLADFKRQLLSILFSASGDVSNQLKSFLVNFQIQSGKISFTTTTSDKIKFSSIRNLLFELEFISASPDKKICFVNSEYSGLFIQQFSKRKVSLKTFKKQQEEKEEVGLNAEKAVIDFEGGRLSDISLELNEIEHVALENVLAGFDIKSFENYLDNDSKRIDHRS